MLQPFCKRAAQAFGLSAGLSEVPCSPILTLLPMHCLPSRNRFSGPRCYPAWLGGVQCQLWKAVEDWIPWLPQDVLGRWVSSQYSLIAASPAAAAVLDQRTLLLQPREPAGLRLACSPRALEDGDCSRKWTEGQILVHLFSAQTPSCY